MLAMDFVEALRPFIKATTPEPFTTQTASYNGALMLVLENAFLKVDNSATKELPNFSMSKDILQLLFSWLSAQPGGEDITVKLSHATLQLSCTLPNYWREAQLTLPVSLSVDQYSDLDEVVLKPLLVNDFYFRLPMKRLYDDANALNYIIPSAEHGVFGLCVSHDEPRVTFTAVSQSGSAYVKYDMQDAEYELTDWLGEFSLPPLLWAVRRPNEPDYSVKISFTDNKKNERSPLMLQYPHGVTLVLPPLWL